jgi:hypothetical protein
MMKIVIGAVISLMIPTLACLADSNSYELTIILRPSNPSQVRVSSDGQRYNLPAGQPSYKLTLPKTSNILSILAVWPPGDDRQLPCARLLKLHRVDISDSNPTIGLSCTPFHLDTGVQAIADINNIPTTSPSDFDNYLTASAAAGNDIADLSGIESRTRHADRTQQAGQHCRLKRNRLFG